MASPQSFPGLRAHIPRERPSCFAPPSPPSGPVLVDESVASGQHNAAHWTTLNRRWMINSRYESQVIATRIESSWGPICCKPSKLLTVTGCRKYDSMTCRSIQRFCGAAKHQALAPSAPMSMSLQNKPMLVTDEFVFSASAKAWRQRQIKVGILFVGPSNKTWFLKCSKKGHSTETCPISLIQNLEKQSRNPWFHSASTYSICHTAGLGVFDNSTRSEMND